MNIFSRPTCDSWPNAPRLQGARDVGTVSATGLMACTIDVRHGLSWGTTATLCFQLYEKPSPIEELGSIVAVFVSAPLLTHDIDWIASRIDADLNVPFGSEVNAGA